MEKQIKNFENYIINDSGVNEQTVWSTKTNKWLKPKLISKGYYMVQLCKEGKAKWFLLHRLVAKAFIDNPENKPYIDHINTITTDNRIENLRWCTRFENQNNELTRQHISEAKKGLSFSEEHKTKLSEAHSKKVYQYTFDGHLIKVWDSTMECEKEGFNQGHVAACCRGVENKHKGYKWSYEPL